MWAESRDLWYNEQVVNGREKSWLNRADWLTFWAVSGVVLAAYVCSLGPSIGLEDAGELATAADVLGVPHPPGYPLWTVLSWVFCRCFSWVGWQGFPNAAWAVALGSAVTGALACGVTALLIARSARDLLHADGAWHGFTCAVAGASGGLMLAFTPGLWSQSVIVEVYALGALFLALTLLLAYRWLTVGRPSTLVWLGLVFGLGLTNYQVLLLAALPLGGLVCVRRWRLARSFVCVAVPLGLTGYLLTLGALPSADLFSTAGAPVIVRPGAVQAADLPGWIIPAGYYAVLGGFAVLWAGCAGFVKRWRWALIALAGLVCTLGAIAWRVYPELRVPEGFRGTVYPFARAWAVHLVGLGVLWWACWPFRRARRFACAVTGVQLAGLLLLQMGCLLGLTHPTLGWFWWPVAWGALVLLLARRLLVQGKWVVRTVLAFAAGLSVYVYMPLVSDLRNPAMNWGYTRTWEGFKHAISRGQYEAISPSAIWSWHYLRQLAEYTADLRMQFSLPVIVGALAGVSAVCGQLIRRRQRRGLLWLGCIGVLFVIMSAVLVALANPSGGIQDGFIQKVKYISSHGLFVLWVGYAVAWGLAVLGRMGKRPVLWLGCAGALCLPLVPVGENLWNNDLVRAVGAAEQTGHDFGWQFGAYMLDGVRQIEAELSEDEEPLPDPFWPPPMAADAIYFGGTDPGRFVPTYMVYSAGMRPDVFVLTQNALADPTYMNVERDLYGKRIWLPSADEVRQAFTDYTDAVATGRRTTQGTIREVNGRVQITGASAVMDICADLARLIYDRNPDHAFYVEESYPIAWMDAFLEPAGLAMRLNRAGADLETVQVRDEDFWDWMTRRLVERSAYRRDFAAQKSFSKLRSAMGGVYARKGQAHAAEQAFLQAMVLYPLSPEVLFRYLREILLPAFRFAVGREAIQAFLQADPKNLRAAQAAERLDVLQEAYDEMQRLTVRIREKQATTADVCALAEVCETLGRGDLARAYWKQVLEAPDLTGQEAMTGCVALQRLRSGKEALALLKRVPKAAWPMFTEAELVACSGLAQTFSEESLAYGLLTVALRKAPQSGRVWLAVALYYYGIGNEAQAYEAMCSAIRFGALPLIKSDEAVAEICLRLTRRFGLQEGALSQ